MYLLILHGGYTKENVITNRESRNMIIWGMDVLIGGFAINRDNSR